MASSISQSEFKEALARYPAVLKVLSRPPKDGQLTLEELDKFRYTTAPMNFSKSTGRQLELDDLKKLTEWKMRHGTFRPTLASLVAKNKNPKIAETLKDGFTYYASNKDDIVGTLDRITKPLSGIGPAAGSLILAIHDPQNVVFFSDELYRWLCKDGEKVNLKYNVKEFEELFGKARAFISKMECTPIELEKAAFTLIKEKEPVYVPQPKKEPSGLPRGRPKMAESDKKPKPVPSGLPRGRPKLADGEEKSKSGPSGLPRGRPAKPASEKKATAKATTNGDASKKRGRPSVAIKAEDVEEEEKVSIPAAKKRKGAPSSAKNTGKKSKA